MAGPIDGKHFIGAIADGGPSAAKKGSGTGKVVRLYSDTGDESLEAVCEALLEMGMEPEGVAALKSRTLRATEKRRQATEGIVRKLGVEVVAKSEHIVITGTEALRTAAADDDLAIDLLAGKVVPWVGHERTGLLATVKAAPRERPAEAFPMRHGGGNPHSILTR
jgi:hypothetical protein